MPWWKPQEVKLDLNKYGTGTETDQIVVQANRDPVKAMSDQTNELLERIDGWEYKEHPLHALESGDIELFERLASMSGWSRYRVAQELLIWDIKQRHKKDLRE